MEAQITSTVKIKRETQTDRITRLNAEYDEKIKARRVEVKQHGDGSLQLIRTEKDVLKNFCPGYGTALFKTAKRFSRKRKLCGSHTTKEFVEPEGQFKEVWTGRCVETDEAGNKRYKRVTSYTGPTVYTWEVVEVLKPGTDVIHHVERRLVSEEPVLNNVLQRGSCLNCLHDDVKCKYRNVMISVLEHKLRNYRFRNMMCRVMGSRWVNGLGLQKSDVFGKEEVR